MNKQELIEYCESLKGDLNKFINGINVDKIIAKIEQLDEPQAIKLKDVIVRIKQLDIGTRKVWLDEFLNKLGSDYGLLKYKAGYEQGKFEGAWVGSQLKGADKIRQELNKPVVPQFVADWIKYCKFTNVNLQNALLVGDVYFYNYANQKDFSKLKEFLDTENNQETFARAWLDGYEVEKEKRYTVKIKAVNQYLVRNPDEEFLGFLQSRLKSKFTRKELENAGFGEVFNCQLFEVEEVEE